MVAEKIVAVGTDGRRLAKMEGRAKASVDEHQTGETMTIVPSRAMQLILRATGDTEETAKICARGNDILVSSAGVTISSRLVEGRFPRWRDVFPEERDSIDIEMTVGPLYSALATSFDCHQQRKPWNRFHLWQWLARHVWGNCRCGRVQGRTTDRL